MARSLFMSAQSVKMISVQDFEAGAHDSVLNVISLTADPLKTFTEIWYSVFLWALFSSLFVHICATLIAFCRLRKHHLGRRIPLAILAMGVISPLTGGVVSSAAIAGVYRASDFIMLPFYALVWGVAQTIVVIFISFSRILATL
ncbi:transmembrane protein 170B-like [Littorina saxatilis]|uniref:Transmembrane protein 170A n=1 Tax=Littorina saxatilis TaxID=31220 RepID=A0AAN9C3R8_9CAEN